MHKAFITYFFSLILIASVVTPTYFTLMEGAYEVAEVVDFGEEEENKGNEAKNDLDTKIYYSNYNSLLSSSLKKKNQFGFFSKTYTSYQKKLTSPPPELYS